MKSTIGKSNEPVNRTGKSSFETENVSRAILQMAGPTIVSMLVTVVYNMTDTYFVGQTGSASQVAAVSLTTPVFLIMMALGNLFGVGGGSSISRALGMDKKERVRQISSSCFYAISAAGLILLLVIQILAEPLVIMLGATQDTIRLSASYLKCLSFGAPFIILSAAFSHLVRAEGDSKKAMTGNLIGTAINIILDPMLILVLNMGVFGAALATVIGNAGAAAFYMLYLYRGRTNLSVHLRDISIAVYGDVFAIGIPAFLNSVLTSVTQIVMNNYLKLYGDSAMAAMGVAHKLNLLVTLILTGLCTGVQPLIAYNYGARNYSRMKRIMQSTIAYSVILGSCISLLMGFSKGFLIRSFIDDPLVITYGSRMLTAFLLTGPFLGILFASMNCMQGMGKALPSLLISVSRQGLLFVPAIIIMHTVWGLNGLIYSQMAADYISIVIAACICLIMLRRCRMEFADIDDTAGMAPDREPHAALESSIIKPGSVAFKRG